MTYGVRRVVTGHDSNGKAVVVMDGDFMTIPERGTAPEWSGVELWVNRSTPADLRIKQGPTEGGPTKLQPPAGGAAFRLVWFEPESTWRSGAGEPTGDRLLGEFGARDPGDAAASRHPLMHRTDTIDYAIMMSGECYLMLDDTEVKVQAGDTVIQLGNNHAWSNRSDQPCQIAFIMIDGQFR